MSTLHVIVVGLNYKTAPVEIRERLSFHELQLEKGMLELKNTKSILENVIISTCNRTEVYAVVDQLHTGKYYIKDFLEKWFFIPKKDFESYLYILENEVAVAHLFKVASGLDSMILGETQILGQVKSSYLLAQNIGVIGTVFNKLFKDAVTVAKKAHSETDISEHPVSVSYAAVELAKKIFGSLEAKHVLVIGAGKMGELALKNLQGSGASNIVVVNRTYEKALAVAEKFDGKARTLDALQESLAEADIVISSTGATDFILTKPLMEEISKNRKTKPMFLVDIAVPRDIDPTVNELDSVFLYDIDDLEGIVEANIRERERAAGQIEKMIAEEVFAFQQWLYTLGVIPLIASLREKALSIQQQTMESLERKLPDLSDREKKIIGKHMKSIVNQMLRDPILQIKELAAKPNGDEALEYFKHIFDLKEAKEEKAQRSVGQEENKRPAPSEFVRT